MRTELDRNALIGISGISLVYVMLTVLYNYRYKKCEASEVKARDYINASTGAVVAIPVIMILLKLLNGNDMGVIMMFMGLLGLGACLVSRNLNRKCTTSSSVRTWTDLNMGLFIAVFVYGAYAYKFKSEVYYA